LSDISFASAPYAGRAKKRGFCRLRGDALVQRNGGSAARA